MIRYCQRCVTPDSRPRVSIDVDGICSVCRNFEAKPRIDWDRRKSDFLEVVKSARSESRFYDCLLPVSGGKDSTWQAVVCLEHGLRVLAYTWRPPGRTPIGQQNIENLARLGVDHIDLTVSPDVEKRFARSSFRKFGSSAVAMHLGIYQTPLRLAVQMRIPLVVYGENSATEYGNPEDAKTGFKVDADWLKHYGVTHGTTVSDWIGCENLTEKDLAPYFAPDIEAVEQAGVRAIFLGYYFPWDVEITKKVALAHGFSASTTGARVGIYDYADLDDDFISVHHWLKWYKFGITRSFDNLSLEIRNGRMSRDQAIEWLRRRGDESPQDDIGKFCAWAGISGQEFAAVCERFRNHEIWEQQDGVWRIPGFLVNDYPWS